MERCGILKGICRGPGPLACIGWICQHGGLGIGFCSPSLQNSTSASHAFFGTDEKSKKKSQRRTDLKIWPSEAKYFEEPDIDVKTDLAPPKSTKNNEKLISETETNPIFSLFFLCSSHHIGWYRNHFVWFFASFFMLMVFSGTSALKKQFHVFIFLSLGNESSGTYIMWWFTA